MLTITDVAELAADAGAVIAATLAEMLTDRIAL